MIVFFAHGSPDARHAADVVDLARRTGVILGEEVTVAYLDHQEPPLSQIAAEATPGSTVVVLPLLLASGVHARVDVPSLVDQVRAARSDVTWLLQPTLPPHTLALAVLDLLGAGTPPTTDGVMPSRRAVVGVVAGSSRQGAIDGFEPLVQSLRVAGVELVVANGPGELEVAAKLAMTLAGGGGVDVVPLMYADGVLVDRTRVLAQQPGWRVTPPVGRSAACAEALANWLWSGVPSDELGALT